MDDENYNDDYFSTDEFSDEDELCGMLPPPYPPPPPPTQEQADANNGKYSLRVLRVFGFTTNPRHRV